MLKIFKKFLILKLLLKIYNEFMQSKNFFKNIKKIPVYSLNYHKKFFFKKIHLYSL